MWEGALPLRALSPQEGRQQMGAYPEVFLAR